MADESANDEALILDMILAARDALKFVEGLTETQFIDSRLHQNAAIRSLEIIGEAANRVSASTRIAEPEVAWREIIGMRHRLIHGYADVRLDRVWFVLKERLVPLITVLERRLIENR